MLHFIEKNKNFCYNLLCKINNKLKKRGINAMKNADIIISAKEIEQGVFLLKNYPNFYFVEGTETKLALELYQFATKLTIEKKDINGYLLAAAKLFDNDFHIPTFNWDKYKWINIIDHYFPPEQDWYEKDEIHAHEDTIEKI